MTKRNRGASHSPVCAPNSVCERPRASVAIMKSSWSARPLRILPRKISSLVMGMDTRISKDPLILLGERTSCHGHGEAGH